MTRQEELCNALNVDFDEASQLFSYETLQSMQMIKVNGGYVGPGVANLGYWLLKVIEAGGIASTIMEFFNSDGSTPENKPTLSQDIYDQAIKEALKAKSDSTFIIIKPDGQLEIKLYGNNPSSTPGQ